MKDPDTPLRVGDMIYGYCNGKFGRDAYDDKRVEYIAADWTVLRYESGTVTLYQGDPEDLRPYRDKPDEDC